MIHTLDTFFDLFIVLSHQQMYMVGHQTVGIELPHRSYFLSAGFCNWKPSWRLGFWNEYSILSTMTERGTM